MFSFATDEQIEKILFDPYVYSDFSSDFNVPYQIVRPSDFADYDIYVDEESSILFLIRETADKVAEIHIASLKSARGKYLFRESLKFAEFGDKVLGFKETYALVPSYHKASLNLCYKLGFKKVVEVPFGTLKNRLFYNVIVLRRSYGGRW